MIFFDIETVPEENGIDKENFREKYAEKINFMPEFNKILTITVWTFKDWEKNYIKNLEWNEEEQIKKFFEITKNKSVCWFNIKNFDLPFIIKRALKYKIEIPNHFRIFDKKPREISNVVDLFEVWKYSVFSWVWNLDLTCKFLGITSPKEEWIDGSKVAEYYNNGKIEEILEYCKRDVNATMELYKYLYNYNLI